MVLIMTMTPLHMTQHGHDLGAVGAVLSAHTFGMFALSPMSGRLSDRFGNVPTIYLGIRGPGGLLGPGRGRAAGRRRPPVRRAVPARLRLEPRVRGRQRAAVRSAWRSPSGPGSRASPTP